MNINLHIERLVVEGMNLPSIPAKLLQHAVRAELGRLLQDGTLRPELCGGVALPFVAGPSIAVTSDIGAHDLGVRIARSIHGSLA